MTGYFKRKLLTTDCSSTGILSLASKKLKPTPATPNIEQDKSPICFFTLPPEIRIMIYNLLLLSQANSETVQSEIIGKTGQKRVCLDQRRPKPEPQSLHPAVLRTCKQIYHEAISTLYAGNVFTASRPSLTLAFIKKIGATNTRLIKSLEIWVPCICRDVSPWIALLRMLAKKAQGLRYLEIAWSTGYYFPHSLLMGLSHRGLGGDVLFVRNLAKVRQLETLEIAGFYAVRWPEYLRKTMGKKGIQVNDRPGNPKRLHNKGCECGWDELQLKVFEAYQKGTRHLNP
ncbi:hypothetical protein BDW62DRAFT_186503 [Aspergillus aurantiobrunneus]